MSDGGLRTIARSPAFNLVAQQAAWWATVLLAAWGFPELGALAMVSFCVAHLALGGAADRNLILAAALTGAVADNALIAANTIAFPKATQFGPGSPLWMIALWAGFGTQLRHGMSWLVSSSARAAVGGALAGPLAYLGGQSLGVISLGTPKAEALVAIGAAWALSLVLLGWLARQTGEVNAGPSLSPEPQP
ncbi:MAG: DUF2878 domain-containing protein [Planctomycetota bacterium]|jgi:hypothetical protein